MQRILLTGTGQVVPEDKLLKSEEYHIQFEGVGLTLPDGLQIMKGVSGEFLPKRTCAIMGPSGAGAAPLLWPCIRPDLT